MEPDGSLLTARIAAGDDRALADAYDLLAGAVHAAARRVLGDTCAAQDVVQDVFVDLWCHPEQYDASLASLRTFLTVCARRRALDLLRSELRRAAREERQERLMPRQREPSPGDQAAAHEAEGIVRDAVRHLPPEQRRVVELAYFDGLSYREVARVTGVSEGTAKSRVRLAFARLASVLDHSLLEPS